MVVAIADGPNKVEISAVNAAGLESPRELFYATGPPVGKRDLYYIARKAQIGIKYLKVGQSDQIETPVVN
jgi:hypothetical protein